MTVGWRSHRSKNDRDVDGRPLGQSRDIDDFGVGSPRTALGEIVERDGGLVEDVEAFFVELIAEGIENAPEDPTIAGNGVPVRIIAHDHDFGLFSGNGWCRNVRARDQK